MFRISNAYHRVIEKVSGVVIRELFEERDISASIQKSLSIVLPYLFYDGTRLDE